jgi:hypothetical protein
MLQDFIELDLEDWFVCTIDAPIMDLEVSSYGGAASRRVPHGGKNLRAIPPRRGVAGIAIQPLRTIEGPTGWDLRKYRRPPFG